MDSKTRNVLVRHLTKAYDAHPIENNRLDITSQFECLKKLLNEFESLRERQDFNKETILSLDAIIKGFSYRIEDHKYFLSRKHKRKEHSYISLHNTVRGLEILFEDRLEYDCMNKVLTMETHPVILEGVPLGKFLIDMRISPLIFSKAPITISKKDDECICAENESHIHPHVSGGELCFGVRGEHILRCFHQGYLVDALEQISSILNTYNDNSPFSDLENWESPSRCSTCLIYSHHQLRYCICSKIVCHECARNCTECEKIICVECVGAICNKCSGNLCRSCKTKSSVYGCRGCRVEANIPSSMSNNHREIAVSLFTRETLEVGRM